MINSIQYTLSSVISNPLWNTSNSSNQMACSCEGFQFFQYLSYDAMLEILSLLSIQDLGRLAQVSKDSNILAEDDIVWRRLCRKLKVEWAKLLNKDASLVPKFPLGLMDWKRAFQKEKNRLNIASKYVGLWNEKWCDVNVSQSTLIESDGGDCFTVTYTKNKFTAQFQTCGMESLSFHLEGGDSGWSFVYTLKPLTENLLNLTVFRAHDNKSFTGFFTRAPLCDPPALYMQNV